MDALSDLGFNRCLVRKIRNWKILKLIVFKQIFSLLIFNCSELEDQIDACNQEVCQLINNLDQWKVLEREHQEKINDDAKELEKMTNKQSLLLKKVGY